MNKNPAISRIVFFFVGGVPGGKQNNMSQNPSLPFVDKTSEVILKKNVMVKQVEWFERKKQVSGLVFAGWPVNKNEHRFSMKFCIYHMVHVM